MSDATVPRTPSPASKGLNSPPPLSSSDLTPPPSTQVPNKNLGTHLVDSQPTHAQQLASPPSTMKSSARPRQDIGNAKLPTLEEARQMSDSECRDLVLELIPAFGEARMALAHSKLQLNLLSIESAEAAQRAEAEHDLTRREVEVLQAGSPLLRNRTTLYPDPRSPLAQVQQHLESSIKQGRELEAENYQLQRRLKGAKKVIKHMDSQVTQLQEDNRLLRQRIRQNREHYNEIRASVLHGLPNTSRPSTHSPQRHRITPANSGRARKSDPLDALLMADEVLNGRADPSSVPATPTPFRGSRSARYHTSHTRGTHSLSSLPSTPSRSRPMTADEVLRTPVNQIVQAPHLSYSAPATQILQKSQLRQREDRDSTISASDEEAVTDEELPPSQASQAASSMLRRYPGPSSKGSPRMEHQEKLVQAKLMGKVTKAVAGHEGGKPNRREVVSDSENEERSAKRARLEKSGHVDVGLGIGLWPSPQRRDS